MEQKKIKVGIIGSAGYTGGELIRLLLGHPLADMVSIVSSSHAHQRIASVHADLEGDFDRCFSPSLREDLDVVFLCVNHGEASKFLATSAVASTTKIIDLSNEFRVKPSHVFQGRTFQYGLPARYSKELRHADSIANPGCFATCIELALLPLSAQNLLPAEVHIHAVTGSTGAGVGHATTSHFSWRSGNVSFYKAFTHQHLEEIEQTLAASNGSAGKCPSLYFLPMRGNFTRGILAGVYFQSDLSEAFARELYRSFYTTECDPFVCIVDDPISLKQVVNTNKCLIHIQKIEKTNTLLITSTIDNLLKGASGQAVQNMNLAFGFRQDMGLRLKPLAM